MTAGVSQGLAPISRPGTGKGARLLIHFRPVLCGSTRPDGASTDDRASEWEVDTGMASDLT